MKEIEKKFKLKNRLQIQKRLLEFGFQPNQKYSIIDIPISPVYEELLPAWPRVRFLPEQKKVILTVKGKRFLEELGIVRPEIEIVSNDFEKSLAFFQVLGFFSMGKIEKTREEYKKEGIEVAIDSVQNLGEFIEIEAKKENEKEALKTIEKIEKLLGLTKRVTKSYFDLMHAELQTTFKSTVQALREKGKAALPTNVEVQILQNHILKLSKNNASYYHGFANKKIFIKKNQIILQ